MNNTIDGRKALEIIQMYSKALMEYEELGVLGVFLVGSLADGNYVAGKSDLDVSVIIKNESDIEQIEKISKHIIEMLVKKYNIPVDFEAFIKKKEMLYAPYNPEQQKTVELMRIRNQAKKIDGAFEVSSIPIPANDFFIADEIYAEKESEKKYGKDFLNQLTEKQLFNYIINFMRLQNFFRDGNFEFNKKKIIHDHFANNRDNGKEEMLIEKIMDKEDKSMYRDYLEDKAIECKKLKQSIYMVN